MLAPASLFARLCLGSHSGVQRVRAGQALAVVLLYLVFAAIQHIGVVAGWVDARASAILTALYLGGSIAFYGVIRAGLNERIHKDPWLTMPQMVLGIVAAAGSYSILGAARGAVLSLMMLVLIFGMFTLRPRQAKELAAFAGALLLAVVMWKVESDPVHYPVAVEAVHLVIAAVMLAVVSLLIERMGAFRAHLRGQRADLQHALEKIRLLASQDELTELPNRRHMGQAMDAEHARFQRSGAAFSLALIDIDGFKRINDTYGHNGGDLVLKTFAQLTRDVLRGSDLMGRWGGEEFLLLLPDTSADEATVCVERMRDHLARLSADAIAPGLRVTFSAGVTEVTAGDEIHRAIERADQAMYRAKSQGRNCTVVA